METGEGRLALVLGALCIVVLVFIAYRPILPGTFLMDDRRLIEEDNPITMGELSPGSIWFRAEWALSTFVFWLQWLAWGARPGWYHAVNMTLHALSAVLLWRLLARLKIPGGGLAGAIFSVHPVAVASVARIAEMKNTLSLPFFLLAALFYARFEDASCRADRESRSLNGGARCPKPTDGSDHFRPFCPLRPRSRFPVQQAERRRIEPELGATAALGMGWRWRLSFWRC